MLMIEYDIGEVAVRPIIEIQHVCLLSSKLVPHVTACDDVDCKCKRICNVVAARLANNANARRNVLLQSGIQHTGKKLKGAILEAATNVENFDVEAYRCGLVENMSCISHRLHEGPRIACARPDMESDTDDIEI